MNTTHPAQPGQISVPKLMAVLSDILSDKYGVKITMTATPKGADKAPAA